jgi:pimeloyl-ACP methyl ester carboxylesterase
VNICISGFTQHRGYMHGILKLREELINAGHATGSLRRVWYLNWKANWQQVVADLSSVCVMHGAVPVVCVAGYSYGGFGALQLCAALESHGIEVQVLTLSDPVGRRWWWPRPLPAITSLLSRDTAFTLPVAANVRLLHSYYQRTNRPQGHRLRLVSAAATQWGAYQELDLPHAQMDDAPEFHACVLEAADSMHGGD